jgi:hypothetical protein
LSQHLARLLSGHTGHSPQTKQQQKNSVAFSPQANYIDWATTTCQRNLVPTFVDRGVTRGQARLISTVVNPFSRPGPLATPCKKLHRIFSCLEFTPSRHYWHNGQLRCCVALKSSYQYRRPWIS